MSPIDYADIVTRRGLKLTHYFFFRMDGPMDLGRCLGGHHYLLGKSCAERRKAHLG